MVWNTREEEQIMGKKRDIHEPGPAVLSSHTPHYVPLPQYARLQMPLSDNTSRMLRMADELRGLAAQIEFCMNRNDLHITRRLHLVHLEFRLRNQRWLEETKQSPGFTEKQLKQAYLNTTTSGKPE